MSRNFSRALAAGASLLALSAPAAQADQLYNDNVVVKGSLCVGLDCAIGENYSYDTIRLKENNVRIKFQDTSTSASFPTNDWQLTANSEQNGGASYFAIDDVDGGKTPFLVTAGAPSNAFYMNSSGNVGLGTSSPVVEVHVAGGDSPTLRLEQNGSSGFTPQTWDVAGNEANFFVRDVTNGSQLPFKIKPGADHNALVIAANNNIGMGTDGPGAALHVRRSDATAKVRIEEANDTSTVRNLLQLINNGGSSITMENSSTSHKWRIFHADNSDLLLSSNASADNELTLDTSGNLTIHGTLTTAGSCSAGCDRVFAEEYEILPIDARAELMWANGYLPNVGPTAEDGPFNISDKMGRMLNELEHAHIYIAQLNERLKVLEETAPVRQQP